MTVTQIAEEGLSREAWPHFHAVIPYAPSPAWSTGECVATHECEGIRAIAMIG